MNNTTTDYAKRTIAKKFIKIFRGLPGVRGSVDGGCIKSPLTVRDVLRHLEGKESLGRYPLFDKIYVQWAAVDFDFKKSHDREALSEKTAKAYAEELFRCGFKHYWFERSKSGLIHLWLFFSEKVIAKKVRYILITIAKTLGLKIANGNVEIFPKQDELNEEHSVGNYINLPYFGALNRNQIERRAILDPNSFLPISLDEFLLKVGDTLISSLEVDAVYEFLTDKKSQEDPNEEKVESEPSPRPVGR